MGISPNQYCQELVRPCDNGATKPASSNVASAEPVMQATVCAIPFDMTVRRHLQLQARAVGISPILVIACSSAAASVSPCQTIIPEPLILVVICISPTPWQWSPCEGLDPSHGDRSRCHLGSARSGARYPAIRSRETLGHISSDLILPRRC